MTLIDTAERGDNGDAAASTTDRMTVDRASGPRLGCLRRPQSEQCSLSAVGHRPGPLCLILPRMKPRIKRLYFPEGTGSNPGPRGRGDAVGPGGGVSITETYGLITL